MREKRKKSAVRFRVIDIFMGITSVHIHYSRHIFIITTYLLFIMVYDILGLEHNACIGLVLQILVYAFIFEPERSRHALDLGFTFFFFSFF